MEGGATQLTQIAPLLRDSVAWGYEFGRFAAIACSPSGMVLLADNDPPSVIVANVASGKDWRNLGRGGSGPGEFRRIVSVKWLGKDSVVVDDPELRRLSVLPINGDPGRTITTSGLGPSVALLGVSTSGLFVLTQRSFFTAQGAFRTGTVRPTVAIVRTENGQKADTITLVPDDASFILAHQNGFTVSSHPFGESTLRLLSGDTLIVGEGTEYVLKKLDLQGKLIGLVRKTWVQQAPTASEWDRAREAVLGPHGTVGQELGGRVFAAMRESDITVPPYARILSDEAGTLWIQGHRLSLKEPAHWLVWKADGRPMQDFLLPAGARLICVTRAFGIALVRDGDEIDRVVRIKLPQ